MKLALGPILYYWERERVFEFYRAVAGWPVDIVYLGEAVCSKRRALRLDDWLEIADTLAGAGKQPVLSTLALVEAESELGAMRRVVGNGRYPVEANDAAALNMLSESRVPFVAGPALNLYNGETLRLLHGLGAHRWVLPVEQSRDMLAALQAARPQGMETEVLVFGRLPLAHSARCFTARTHQLPKDDCGFRCIEHPDGLPLHTREGKRFLTINGIQTQSGESTNLIGALPELIRLGVEVARLSPQSTQMEPVVRLFRDVLDNALDAAQAETRMMAFLPDGMCNGYWHGQPGMAWQPFAFSE